MTAKAHPRAVGVFVLGAVALALAAIVLLSSGNWFEPRHRFAVFFPGSVRGLNPGAPVTCLVWAKRLRIIPPTVMFFAGSANGFRGAERDVASRTVADWLWTTPPFGPEVSTSANSKTDQAQRV